MFVPLGRPRSSRSPPVGTGRAPARMSWPEPRSLLWPRSFSCTSARCRRAGGPQLLGRPSGTNEPPGLEEEVEDPSSGCRTARASGEPVAVRCRAQHARGPVRRVPRFDVERLGMCAILVSGSPYASWTRRASTDEATMRARPAEGGRTNALPRRLSVSSRPDTSRRRRAKQQPTATETSKRGDSYSWQRIASHLRAPQLSGEGSDRCREVRREVTCKGIGRGVTLTGRPEHLGYRPSVRVGHARAETPVARRRR